MMKLTLIILNQFAKAVVTNTTRLRSRIFLEEVRENDERSVSTPGEYNLCCNLFRMASDVISAIC